MVIIEGKAHLDAQGLLNEHRVMHPAFSISREPDLNIWEPLWSSIFENEVVISWLGNADKWMLRCVGAPGSGKTNLSAFMVKALKEIFHGNGKAVAAVFIESEVTSSSTAFVEDVLNSVFLQFRREGVQSDLETEKAYDKKYHLHQEAKKHGHRDLFRIQLIREALCSLIEDLDDAYLVIDDFDRCNPTADLFLENELSLLVAKGLKVFLTSRIPCLKIIPEKRSCDSCFANDLQMFWSCKGCEETVGYEDAHILCQDCRNEDFTCDNCQDSATFYQPFDHIELDLKTISEGIERFIDWDLEMEHGDLGLNDIEDGDGPGKPPLSNLGRLLNSSRTDEALTALRKSLKCQAEENISLARLRLSNALQFQSLESILSPLADVLPHNIVAFFHAAMQQIENQPPSQRDLGFTVIAAVAHYDCNQGIPYEALNQLLQNPTKTSASQHPIRTQSAPAIPTKRYAKKEEKLVSIPVPHRSLEELLHAARGFVVMGGLNHRPLKTYCEAFRTYAREDYNESIVWARAQIDFDSVAIDQDGVLVDSGITNLKMKRSKTFQIGGKERAVEQVSLPKERRKASEWRLASKASAESVTAVYVVKLGRSSTHKLLRQDFP